jgi:hypothetical protein
MCMLLWARVGANSAAFDVHMLQLACWLLLLGTARSSARQNVPGLAP